MDMITAYTLGKHLEYLWATTLFKIGVDVKGDKNIIDELEFILDILSDEKLSENTQFEIKRYIEKLNVSFEVNQTVKAEDANILHEHLKIWSDRIQNELKQRKIIDINTSGILNPKKLMEGANGFFCEEVWNKLSNISKSDLNDACNCLLTQSWTPAVMISLRAAEDSLRGYYKFKTGKDLDNWKQITDELHAKHIIDETILGYFNYIRKLRNTAAHPDSIFEQMEAEGVFHKVVGIINITSQN